MRALVHDPDAPLGLRLGEAPDPRPGASQVMIRVAAASLNFADVAYLRGRQAPGAVPGFDAAGVVSSAAGDGSGPSAGARVVTFGYSGGWAELRAADTAELAVVPDELDLGLAAAIPAAGVTALRALRRLGPVAGRRVLITGASGGVGRFAVQLAARAGAHVIRSEEHTSELQSREKLVCRLLLEKKKKNLGSQHFSRNDNKGTRAR